MFHTNPAKKGCACNAAFNMLHARVCTCRTDYIDMNKKVSEYDQEIPQSQTAATPWHREEEPLNHCETPGRQTKQSNQLSLPHQDDCNTRMDIK